MAAFRLMLARFGFVLTETRRTQRLCGTLRTSTQLLPASLATQPCHERLTRAAKAAARAAFALLPDPRESKRSSASCCRPRPHGAAVEEADSPPIMLCNRPGSTQHQQRPATLSGWPMPRHCDLCAHCPAVPSRGHDTASPSACSISRSQSASDC